jgi:hypothetical protein
MGIPIEPWLAPSNHDVWVPTVQGPNEEGVIDLTLAIGIGHPPAIWRQRGLADGSPKGVVVHGHSLQTLRGRVPANLLGHEIGLHRKEDEKEEGQGEE